MFSFNFASLRARLGGDIQATRELLQIPPYRRYFRGRVVFSFGGAVQELAELLMLYSFRGSATDVGVKLAAAFVPGLAATLYGGVLADRWGGRPALVVGNLLLTAHAVVLLLAVWTETVSPQLVWGLTAVRALVSGTLWSVHQAFTAQLVGRDRVGRATGVTNGLLSLSATVAPLVVWGLGVRISMLIWPISTLVMAAVCHSIRSRPVVSSDRGQLAQLVQGFRYALSTPVLAVTLLSATFVGLGANALNVVWPALAGPVGSDSMGLYAWLTGCFGAGGTIASVAWTVVGRVTMRAVALFALGVAMTAYLTAFLAASTSALWSQLIVLFLMGATTVGYASATTSLMTRESGEAMHGRMGAMNNVVIALTTIAGALLMGAAIDAWGVRWGLALCGASALAGALVAGGTRIRIH